MTTNFRRWETDPFFSAAEDVQDSADRLESAYRSWVYLKGHADDPEAASSIDIRRRELKTALGTAKWQLEEFERAVQEASLMEQLFIAKDASARHRQFVEAIHNQILSVENDLCDFEEKDDATSFPAVSLHDQDKHDLALFLFGARPVESSVNKAGFTESVLDKDASTSVFDEETKDEDPSTSSGSRDSKKSLDIFENGHVNIQIAAENYSTAQQLSDGKYIKGEGMCRVSSSGLVNGHDKSVSGASDVDNWSFIKTTSDKIYSFWKNEGRGNRLSSWAFGKKKHLPELKFSRRGFKRWKDGDFNSKYYKRLSGYFSFNMGPRDMEMGLNNSCFGRNMKLLRGDVVGSSSNGGENGWREAFQHGLQRIQISFQLPRTVQLASAMLVALGIIGLVSFQAIGAL